MNKPLMPKAIAVWLVENTGLSFDQIADFTGMHEIEVQGIADGEVAQGIRGTDPVTTGDLTRAEIERCQADPKARLKMTRRAADSVSTKRKGARYTPLAKRQDRPDAIAWILRNHPYIPDPVVCKLLGTTKTTLQAVRDRTHWKSQDISPRDPVLLGLCSQTDLDEAVRNARIAEGLDPDTAVVAPVADIDDPLAPDPFG